MPAERMNKLLPDFVPSRITTSEAAINTLVGGKGPALLLLHGHPQTLVCWHKIAPERAWDFTVVLTDLRGYGDSSKPKGGEEHIAYSKRQMAQDQIEVMKVRILAIPPMHSDLKPPRCSGFKPPTVLA